jgi:serine/threonine-protein kinase/endoribonuclease IRE1
MQKIGSLSFDMNDVIGRGSSSVVFRGLFGQRHVAIKRVEKSKQKLVQQEIDLLQKSDRNSNIIRYFVTEEDAQYYYIALELCVGSLKDYLQSPEMKAKITKKKVIDQVINGMEWLHSLKIIHRDVKPSNVLLMEKSSDELEVKISDFGFAKQIDVPSSQMSVVPDESSANYWTVPEMRENKYTAKSDVFSTGCLIYYVANNGTVPQTVDKIAFPSSCDQFSNCVLLKHLVLVMTRKDPNERPTFQCLRFHPFFWDDQKKLNFILAVADRIKNRDFLGNAAACKIEEGQERVFGNNWESRLESVVISSLAYRSRNHNYAVYSITELLRAIRNKAAHYDEMSPTAKETYGTYPDGYVNYWTGKFPLLLIHIYVKINQCDLARDPNFSSYYPQNQICENARKEIQ